MSKRLTKLTDWETGEDLYIDYDAITLIQRLPPEQYDDLYDEPVELGARTKLIVEPQQIVLVREEPEEIVNFSIAIAK